MKNILFLLFLSSALLAQNNPPSFELLTEGIHENQQAKGSYLIYKDGNTVYQGFFSEENKSDSRYHIGSISKTFTATLIMLAKEDGKLSLDQNLADWFPRIAHASEINLRQMLLHQSGIHNFTNDATYAQYMTLAQDRAALLQRFASLEPDFEPGAQTSYSNTAYVLLSFVLEEVYEQAYAEILEEKICKPLGLKNTYLAQEAEITAPELPSYAYTGSWTPSTLTHPSIPMGAGAIVSTPQDLAQFIRALFQGKILKEESLAEMKPKADSFGYGLISFPLWEKRLFGHNGGIDGFVSHFSYLPEEDLALVVCLNGMRYPLNDLLIDMASIYFNKEGYQLPNFEEKVLPLDSLKQYEGTYQSENFPLDIKIFVEESRLKGQASGQPAFPLEAQGNHAFSFKAAGIKMKFLPEQNAMEFEQNALKLRFTR